VHDLLRLSRRRAAAAAAQPVGDVAAYGIRKRKVAALTARLARVAPKPLISNVGRAELVAMQQHGGRSGDVDDERSGQQGDACCRGERVPEEKIAIARDDAAGT